VDSYRELGRTYGSRQRDQGMILETLVRLDKQTDAFEMIRDSAEYMGNSNNWMSSQATAYCLIGIAEFAKKFPPSDGIDVKVSVADNDFRIDTDKYINQVTLIEPDANANIEILNKGETSLFVRVIRTGVPIEGIEEAKESNIKLVINYRDMGGKVLNPENIEKGTDFVAEVEVTNPGFRGDYEEIAITQIFPSGWEIINTRLDDMDQLMQEDPPEYQDIRDDRVMTYFDLKQNKSMSFKILLNASYEGKYYLPAVFVEAMYDNSIAANTVGKWINVSAGK